MQLPLSITSSCNIAGHRIVRNGKELFRTVGDEPATDFLIEAYKHFNFSYPKYYKMDGLSKLGWLTTELLLDGLTPLQRHKQDEISLVISNRNSSLDTDIRYYETVQTMASPALFVYTLPNIMMGEICIRHQFKGENAFFIFDKFDPEFICNYVTTLFNTGATTCCICGWIELLGNEYHGFLMMVEANNAEFTFVPENIYNLYQTENG